MQYGTNHVKAAFAVTPLDDSLDHVVLSFHDASPVQVQQGEAPFTGFDSERNQYDDWRPFPPPVEHDAAD